MFLIAFALAAPLLVLPPGEDPWEWAGPTALAGLNLADGDPTIDIRDLGATWEIRIAGGTRALVVDEPVDGAGRERVAALARSLSRGGITFPDGPVGAPPVQQPVPPARAPLAPMGQAQVRRGTVAAPAPSTGSASPSAADDPATPPVPAFGTTTGAEAVNAGPGAGGAWPPPSAPDDGVPLPAPPTSLPAPPTMAPVLPSNAPPIPPPWPRKPLRFVARASAQARERQGLTPAGGAAVSAGIATGSWEAGIGVDWSSRRELGVIDDAASMSTRSLFATGAWSSGHRLAPLVALSIGAEARRFTSGPAWESTLWVPMASIELGARLRLTDALALEGGLSAAADLGRTLLQLGDAAPVPLASVEFGGTFSLRFATR